MQCVSCKHGETQSGEASGSLERDGTTVVIASVPVVVCGTYGVDYWDDAITERVLAMAELGVGDGAEIELQRFAVLRTTLA